MCSIVVAKALPLTLGLLVLGAACRGPLLATDQDAGQAGSASAAGMPESRQLSRGDFDLLKRRLAAARRAADMACKKLGQADCRPLREGVERATRALREHEQQAERRHEISRASAPVMLAAAAVLGDDVTGIGVADDPLLLPILGAAALGAYLATPATAPALGTSVQQLRDALGELERRVRALAMGRPHKDEEREPGEHTKNARPSTREKHEAGQARKQRDQKGEKKDARRRYER